MGAWPFHWNAGRLCQHLAFGVSTLRPCSLGEARAPTGLTDDWRWGIGYRSVLLRKDQAPTGVGVWIAFCGSVAVSIETPRDLGFGLLKIAL